MTWTDALPILLAVIAVISSIVALLKGRNKEKADVATAITEAAGALLEEYRTKIDEIEVAMVEQAEKIRSQGRKIARQSGELALQQICLLYTSPSPRDRQRSRMPSSA